MEPNLVREIGARTVHLTEAGRADTLFAGHPEELPVFQCHGETFSVLPPGRRPPGHVTGACRHQAFRVGARAYGFQFHFEVDEPMVGAWARAYADELRADRGLAPEELVAEYRGRAAALERAGAALARNLLALWDSPAAPPRTH